MYVYGKYRSIHLNYFRNGTIHLTGVKNTEDVVYAVSKLPIDTDIKMINISMINLNYNLKYQINKKLLLEELHIDNIPYVINKTCHIIVNFKTSTNRSISLNIHQNSLIISKCTSNEEINEVYDFIRKFFEEKIYKIIDVSILDVLHENPILKTKYNGKYIHKKSVIK